MLAAPTGPSCYLSAFTRVCVCEGVNKDVGVRLLSYMTVETLGGCGNTDTDSRLELEPLPSPSLPSPRRPLDLRSFPVLRSALGGGGGLCGAVGINSSHTPLFLQHALSLVLLCGSFLGVHPSGL